MSIEAYPLYWPEGWKRCPYPTTSRFKTGFGAARNFLTEELGRLCASRVVVSSNVPLRNDGLPRANMPEPKDVGVAVYFRYKQKDIVLACDRYRYTRDNVYAIAKTIEAMRGIERWGASDMMERAFSGFKALNATNARPWWEVLELEASAMRGEIEAAFRYFARKRHPDAGGSHDAMSELNEARRIALLEIGA